jgi:hypothetical protein
VDGSLKSFVFTLKNPHNMPAKTFALKVKEKQDTIVCDSKRGPCFYTSIYVYDNCNTNTGSYTSLGHTYINDTGLTGNIVFTGSKNFQVKEIEVFEIAA